MKTQSGDHAFSAARPRCWNSISLSILEGQALCDNT